MDQPALGRPHLRAAPAVSDDAADAPPWGWSLLRRAPGWAASPASVGLGVVTLLFAALLSHADRLWQPAPSLGDALSASVARSAAAAWDQLRSDGPLAAAIQALGLNDSPGIVGSITTTLAAQPLSAFVLGPVILATLALGALAIARRAAHRLGGADAPAWPGALAFALRRGLGIIGAVLALPLAAALLWAVLMLLAHAFRVPWLDVLAALLAGPALALSVLAGALLIAWLVALPMIPAALACEDCDGVDALQRALAYVVARPLRSATWTLALAVLAVALGLLINAVAGVGVRALAHAIGAAAPAPVALPMPETTATQPPPLDHLRPGARRIVDLWLALPALIAAGYAFSVLATGGVAMYAALRRAVDGQDESAITLEEPAPLAPVALAGPDDDDDD